MSEETPSSHWQDLAQQIGAPPPPQGAEESPATVAREQAEARPKRERKKTPQKKSGPADWNALASALDIPVEEAPVEAPEDPEVAAPTSELTTEQEESNEAPEERPWKRRRPAKKAAFSESPVAKEESQEEPPEWDSGTRTDFAQSLEDVTDVLDDSSALEEADDEEQAEKLESEPEERPSRPRRRKRGGRGDRRRRGEPKDEDVETHEPEEHAEDFAEEVETTNRGQDARERQRERPTDKSHRVGKSTFRNIQTWDEVVGHIIEANLEARKRGERGSNRGRGRGGGRSRGRPARK